MAKILSVLLLVLGLLFHLEGRAAGATGNSFWLTQTSFAAASFVMAEDPEGFGRAVVILSPVLASPTLRQGSWGGYLAVTLLTAGYGAWNISMADESSETVLRRNFLLFNSLLFTSYLLEGDPYGGQLPVQGRMQHGYSLFHDPSSRSSGVLFTLAF